MKIVNILRSMGIQEMPHINVTFRQLKLEVTYFFQQNLLNRLICLFMIPSYLVNVCMKIILIHASLFFVTSTNTVSTFTLGDFSIKLYMFHLMFVYTSICQWPCLIKSHMHACVHTHTHHSFHTAS